MKTEAQIALLLVTGQVEAVASLRALGVRRA